MRICTNALALINEGQPLKHVAAMLNIPRRTLSAKKANYHIVGILRNLVEPEQTSWDVGYVGGGSETGGNSFVFKEPANPNFKETPICDIVEKLAKPQFIKNNVCFTDTACFSGHIIR